MTISLVETIFGLHHAICIGKSSRYALYDAITFHSDHGGPDHCFINTK